MSKNELSPAKRALLEKWLKGQVGQKSTTISTRPPDSRITLSYPQQRQLFLELLDRGTAVNNLSVLLELTGRLDLGKLENSAKRIFNRHDVLRTKYIFGRGLPEPQILSDYSFTIPIVDLRKYDLNVRKTKARELAEKEVIKPFNLNQTPLIRLQLYVLSNELHFLLLVVHHTIADGWSLGVFLKELMIYYSKVTTGTTDELPDLPIQYADFAHWQTDQNQEKEWRSSMKYWKEQLGGELPVLELPTDHPRGARQTFSGRTHHFRFSSEIIDLLDQFNRREDVTLFMTLLAVFYILLYRYSGQEEILIGTPVANRNLPELEHLIGVFINTLVLRCDLSGDPSFREILIQVRDISLKAYSHQDLPFEKLVEELKPQRDLSRTPLFQVVFNLQNSPLPKLNIPGISTRFLELDRGVSQFDLTLMISKIEGQVNALAEYNSDLFEPSTITRMFDSYQKLLKDAITNPTLPVSKLKLIDKEEEYRLVHKKNQTQIDFPREKCFHQLFEIQVEKTPDAIAVIFNNTSKTYRELNRQANVLARHLGEMGVGPGIRVGILMEKSFEIIDALLGVHKAGGIYVPIPTSFPTERLRYILKDADVSVLITNIDVELQDDHDVCIVKLNDDLILTTRDESNLQSNITPEDLAYIMYTSGSTGNPKGVMVQHFALVNFLWSMLQKPGINKDDILLSVTSISFDIAALELFLPLLTGATVVITPKEMINNPLLIGEAIDHYQVSVMQATPAIWQLLLDTGWKGKPGLKALCGGDVLTRTLADKLLDRVESLWNMYGPTETTIWSSISQIQKKDTPIIIGDPINNTQLYILDHHLQAVPVGVVGELHIGGEGLAKGYLNQPNLTEEKFIPDNFSSKPGARLYKTGDLSRFLSDYSIELLGRTDNQVKINGHRIELGEIESVLMQHPSVQESIVIARSENSGEKRIVAYLILTNEKKTEDGELRNFIRKKLPSYMIPSVFIRLDNIPLTINGKIDRKSLPIPEDLRRLPGYVAPRNDEERILAKIWQDALEIEEVGVNDNFFDLGGASIQSLEIVAKANMVGYRFNVEDIFTYQTIAELVAKLNKE